MGKLRPRPPSLPEGRCAAGAGVRLAGVGPMGQQGASRACVWVHVGMCVLLCAHVDVCHELVWRSQGHEQASVGHPQSLYSDWSVLTPQTCSIFSKTPPSRVGQQAQVGVWGAHHTVFKADAEADKPSRSRVWGG